MTSPKRIQFALYFRLIVKIKEITETNEKQIAAINVAFSRP